MLNMEPVSVLGLGEHVRPIRCPSRYRVAGDVAFIREEIKKLAEEKGLPLLGQIPLVQGIREGGDSGKPISIQQNSVIAKAFTELTSALISQVEKRNTDQAPTELVQINTK